MLPRLLKFLLLTLACAALCLSAGCEDDDDEVYDTTPSIDVTGDWRVTIGGRVIGDLALTQSGFSVTGTDQGGVPVAGSVSRNTLTLTVLVDGAVYSAVVSGDAGRLSGTATRPEGGAEPITLSRL